MSESHFTFSEFVAGFWRMESWDMTPMQRLSLIEQYLELGVTTMDHADIYGQYQCETLFGEALALKPALRQQMQIVSKCGIKPAFACRPERYVNHYDTSCKHIIASVEQALTEPVFSHRIINNERDLNRCFKPPFDDRPGQLAEDILQTLKAYLPEAALDLHNTSGSGPAVSVVVHEDKHHDALTALFTDRQVITHFRLGALMEITEFLCPTVTIECGGRLDDSAHETAFAGLQRFFGQEHVLSEHHHDWPVERLHNPVRLEIQTGRHVNYENRLSAGVDLSLDPGIVRYNNGVTPAGTVLGVTPHEDIHQLFKARNSLDQCILKQLIYIDAQQLKTRQDVKLFMVTTNPSISLIDCLFYAVNAKGKELLLDLNLGQTQAAHDSSCG